MAGAGRVSAADEKEKATFKRVSFPTCDGMELGGTYYPSVPAAGEKDKDAVVMLLHNFSHGGGGGSHKDGWDDLAAKLQKNGYAVLSFDFRGFGDSKSVSPEFWKFRHNQMLKGFRGAKSAESIDQKDFPRYYYSFLINDVAAARAFLDRKNDSREVNSSNLIVIGAGQGATLGALWMAAEMHRQKDTSPPMIIPQAFPRSMDDPEGRDLAAAIWLTISPNLEGRPLTTALKAALVEVARENKVPTAFLYGKNDGKAVNLTLDYLKAITGMNGKRVELKNTGEKAISSTDLTGSKLITERLSTTSDILKQLSRVMDERGSKEWKKREEEKSRYFWTASGRAKQLAKLAGEKVVRPIPSGVIGLR